MQGKVEICGVNTSKLKVLKNEETMELLRRPGGKAGSRKNLIKRSSKLPTPVRNYFPGGDWQFCSFYGKMGQKNDERGSFL